MSPTLGRLLVVATPIGNLSDISPRACQSLATADLIAAEDTRHTGLLLQHLGLKKPFLSYQKFNEASRESEILGRLRSGQTIAIVTDSGMPSISDPGERIIRAARRENLPIEVIPGPSAVLHALIASGLPALPFYFGGFLPPKSGGRQKELTLAAARDHTSIYFESPHRLARTLLAITEIFPSIARICVARELTKKFEEVFVGSTAEVASKFGEKTKGEITLVLSPFPSPTPAPWPAREVEIDSP
ncbi:MAG: 16S rRNA (cytidine(1402)-2'-O)-methyltransferase [Verrucomicrobia bacterium]|nr:16S rRNA (cytidine(1402)-2'-O)-methyltransferase [Verrucomicrobiota bacterium]